MCRMGDLALLWPINQKVLHECFVEAVGRESVVLKITPTARDAWYVHVYMYCMLLHAYYARMFTWDIHVLTYYTFGTFCMSVSNEILSFEI